MEYTSLVRTRVSSYLDRLTDVLGKAKYGEEYLVSSRIRKGEVRYTLYGGEVDNDEEHGGSTTSAA